MRHIPRLTFAADDGKTSGERGMTAVPADLVQRLAAEQASLRASTPGLRAPAPNNCGCNGTQWSSYIDGVGIERATRCRCWMERQRAWALDTPREFQLARMANYKAIAGNRVAIGAAKEFFTGFKDLYLFGGVGAGKTRLACSILNELFAQKQDGWFVRVPLMLRKLQPRPDDDSEAESYEYRLMHEPYLCMDDLGAEREKSSDFTRRTVLMIAEARHDAGARTIWTSNKSLDELAEMQDDDRLTSRLAGWCEVVELACSDQRVAR